MSSLVLLLLLAGFLACQVIAGGVVGGLEKIYFWDAYLIAWAYKGRTQNYIMQQAKSKGAANSHWGSGPNTQLTFQEFMDDITNKDRGTCKVAPPDSTRDIMTVANELYEAGYGGETQAEIANRKIGGKKVIKDHRTGKVVEVTKYSQLINTLYAMVTQARGSLPEDTISAQVNEMKEIIPKIYPMRIAESFPYSLKDINVWFDANVPDDIKSKYGGSLQAIAKTETISGIEYQMVDWRATAKAYPAFFKDKSSKTKLKNWIDNYGDAAFAQTGETITGYTKAAMSHFQTVSSLDAALKDLQKSTAECKKK